MFLGKAESPDLKGSGFSQTRLNIRDRRLCTRLVAQLAGSLCQRLNKPLGTSFLFKSEHPPQAEDSPQKPQLS